MAEKLEKDDIKEDCKMSVDKVDNLFVYLI